MLTNAFKQIQRHDCLDDFMIAHRNRVFAAKAWYREQHCHKNRPHLDEFKAGFLQGYMDIAEGGDGCLPCVAPDQFWGWRYQSPDGQAAINAWFAGYPLGIKAAEQDGVGHWGHSHYGEHSIATTSKPQETSATPAQPGGEPLPTGPDGLPMMQETILPGSARFVPDGQPVEAFELEQAIEALETPEPAAAEPQPAPSPMPASNDEAAVEVPVEELPRQPQPQSAPATYSLGDVDDDGIEGLFGFAEAADDAGTSAGNEAISAATTEASEAALESANADEEIPFKFE